VIDASTAHRTAPGWTYGFPEMARGQRTAIAAASRISNPGCWPTGFIALARPLVEAGLAPPDWPITVGGVSGYSGGGKAMIAEFEDASSPTYVRTPFRLYGLGMGHKHAPEMQRYAGLTHAPLFSPAVGRYYQGMLVEVPLPLHALPATPSLDDIHAALADAYAGETFIEVVPLARSRSLVTIDPEGVNGTNQMRLHVFGSAGQARLVALLDNLGKGASGAAVQTLNLLLGIPEATGL
jgi:N-acetyl-gamma-glutamyl-phosphate reductase